LEKSTVRGGLRIINLPDDIWNAAFFCHLLFVHIFCLQGHDSLHSTAQSAPLTFPQISITTLVFLLLVKHLLAPVTILSCTLQFLEGFAPRHQPSKTIPQSLNHHHLTFEPTNIDKMGEPTLNPSSANHRPLNSPAVSASSMYSQDDPKYPFPSTASSTSDVELQPASHQQQVLNGDQNVISPPAKKPAFHARLSRMFSHKGDIASLPNGREKESGAMNGFKSITPDLTAKPVGLERHVSSTLHAQPSGGVEKHAFVTEKKTVQETPQSKRFTLHEDGTHEHLLKNDRRQEKLSNMFRNMLGKRKEGPEDHQLSLISSWVDQVKSEKEKEKLAADQKGGPNSADTLVQKYGKCQEVVGRGAFGIVRISHKADSSDPRKELLYAVKEFRRRPSDSPKKYHQRLTSEFCISSALRHPNVIHTLDLMKDAKGDFCEVMEFCAGGDLYTLVLAAGKLEVLEADCYFKQLMRGVEYIHEMGVAHRDLKPENLLLTSHGSLKITDFGNGECFRMAWEKEPHMVAGLCGSAPYIAPEEYVDNEFDPRAVDVWACGVIYMAMRTGRHLWRLARKDEDEFFERYLEGRRDEDGYGPIETLHRVSFITLTSFFTITARPR